MDYLPERVATVRRRVLEVILLAPATLSLLSSASLLFALVSTERTPMELLGAQSQMPIPYVCASMATSRVSVIMLVALEVSVRLLCGLLTLGLLWHTLGNYSAPRLILGSIALCGLTYLLFVYVIVKLIVVTASLALLPILAACIIANAYLSTRIIQLSKSKPTER